MKQTIQDLKLAFIGVSHWHVPLYLRAISSDNLNVVAVSDPNLTLAQRTATLVGCHAYSDAKILLDREKPDFVFAFAPHHEMPTLALELIDRGIPFAIEKPLGLNSQDVEQVMVAAREKNSFCAIPFIWRYSDLMQAFKAKVSPEDIIHLSFKFVAGPPSRYLATSPWMLRTALAGGGCMTNLGIHFLDMAMYLTDCSDAQVLASSYHRHTDYDIECYATSLLRMKTGTTLLLETGYAYPMEVSQRDNRWNVVTKNGYYTLEGDYFEERVYGEKTIRRVMSTDSDVYYPVFVRETLRQYLAGELPQSGLPEILAVRRVLDEMNRQGT